MTPLRTLIVDDERPARERLDDLLAREPDADLIGTCTGGEEAVRTIRAEAPNLVLLDVQMPEVSGLDVVERVGPSLMPTVIFVTAYDEYALEAFKLAALDYLLKPFDDERFKQTWERARRRHRHSEDAPLARKMSQLLEETRGLQETSSTDDYLKRIAVKGVGQVRVVPVEELRYIRADGSHLKLYTEEGAHLIRENMKTLEARLDPERFLRIHRSTMVDLDRVVALQPHPRESGHAVRLEDGTHLKISRGRKEATKKRLGMLS